MNLTFRYAHGIFYKWGYPKWIVFYGKSKKSGWFEGCFHDNWKPQYLYTQPVRFTRMVIRWRASWRRGRGGLFTDVFIDGRRHHFRFRFNNFTRNKSDIKNQSPLGSPLWFGSTPHFTQEPGCISGFYNPWWQESHKVGLTGVYGGIWWICISAVYGWKQATWKNAEFLVVDHHPFYGL